MSSSDSLSPQPAVRRPSAIDELIWSVTDTLVMAGRNLKRYRRLPRLLFFSTVQPVMFVLLFTFVFGGAIQTPGIDYIDYLLPGIMVQAVLFGAAQTTVGLSEDITSGMIDRFKSLPMARPAVMAGRTLADSVRNVFVVLLMAGVGYLIGFDFKNGALSAAGAIFVVVLFGHAVSWASAIIGLISKDSETAQVAGFVWIFPLVFASSAFVPVQTMPDWLEAFATRQPVSLTVDAARALTLGGDMAPVWKSLTWSAGLALVFIPLSVIVYRRTT